MGQIALSISFSPLSKSLPGGLLACCFEFIGVLLTSYLPVLKHAVHRGGLLEIFGRGKKGTVPANAVGSVKKALGRQIEETDH